MEKDIEKYIRNEIEKMGGMCLKFVSPGNAGVPDRLVLLPGGRVWFIEVKQDGGRVRPLQRWWQKKLRAVGVPSLIIKGMTEAKVFIVLLQEGGGDHHDL